MTKAKDSINFEKTMNELEKVVHELEQGEVSLDLSLEKFEKGIKLYKECKKYLVEAEKRVQLLTEDLKEEDL